jgi:hypothetical protein
MASPAIYNVSFLSLRDEVRRSGGTLVVALANFLGFAREIEVFGLM